MFQFINELDVFYSTDKKKNLIDQTFIGIAFFLRDFRIVNGLFQR